MRDNEKTEFAAVLSAALEVFGKAITPNAIAVWWEALKRFDVADVRRGLSVAIASSRFAPTPADVIAAISDNDGRPGADEAWAMAPKSESETATWTDEIREAWGIASDLYDPRNETPARMAFRDAYNRLVGEARRAGTPARWSVTLGQDVAGRELAITAAVQAGRLTHQQAVAMLPAPADVGPIVSAIAGNAVPRLQDLRLEDRQIALKHLEKIREILNGKAAA